MVYGVMETALSNLAFFVDIEIHYIFRSSHNRHCIPRIDS
jgi:hypothetical protein